MKKTTSKAQQLRLVRNVVRQLSPTDLGGVGGGARCDTCSGTCGGDTKNNCGCTITCIFTNG